MSTITVRLYQDGYEGDTREWDLRVGDEITRDEEVYRITCVHGTIFTGDVHGNFVYADAVKASTITVRCGCQHVTDHVWCGWIGPVREAVVVEWMLLHLRASHEAAGNSGVWPHNGSLRLPMHAPCAAQLLESDPQWTTVLT